MKNFSLFVSTFALFASTSYAAINCGSLPSCASLGYIDIVDQCPQSSTGASMYIKCPFDETKGKCIREAAVGEIVYFAAPIVNAEKRGWLQCDGKTYPRSKYPELSDFLDHHPLTNTSSQYGNPYCNNKYHGGEKSCASSSVFSVPDYRGYFLRVTSMWNPDQVKLDKTKGHSLNNYFIGGTALGVAEGSKAPQAEELPNLKGSSSIVFRNANNSTYMNGAFSGSSERGDAGYDSGKFKLGQGDLIFDASKTTGTGQGVYKEGGHVIPANYSVYAYIYAGKIVE